jgi:hypothetical protein
MPRLNRIGAGFQLPGWRDIMAFSLGHLRDQLGDWKQIKASQIYGYHWIIRTLKKSMK